MAGSIGERISELINKVGYESLGQLSKDSGVSTATLSRIIHDIQRPTPETLKKLAPYLKISYEMLMQIAGYLPDGDTSSLIPGAFPAGKMVKLPVLGVIRAGAPILAVEHIIGWEEVPEEDVKNGEYFFLKVTGDSMKDANIPDGSYVLVRKQDYVDDGKIAVVLVNGEEATVKKVKYINGKVMLLPANPAYEPQVYGASEVKIIGRVVSAHIRFD